MATHNAFLACGEDRASAEKSRTSQETLLNSGPPLTYTYTNHSDTPTTSTAAGSEPPGKVRSKKNIILFGDTGSGKSSIVNMLPGDRQAGVSNAAKGVTFQSDVYHKRLRVGKSEEYEDINIHDTAGINEANTGTVPTAKAVENLWNLLGKLEEDGLHLLVLVIKGPRLTYTGSKNYRLLKALVGDDSGVPMALIVTGLENEADADQWWRANKRQFEEEKMRFDGRACITATRGRLLDLDKPAGGCVYDDVYEASIPKVERLFLDTASTIPYKQDRRTLIVRKLVDICSFFGLQAPGFNKELFDLLQKIGVDERQAKKLTNKAATKRKFHLLKDG